MTMVNERTGSLAHTWEFLRELSRDNSLPESLRLQAKQLLRHYPEPAAIHLEGRAETARREALSQLADAHDIRLPPVLGIWLNGEPFLCDESG
ncbi:hypothetical protein GFL01_21910 [Pseudomonas stutzeri]|nr:hypothetical protein [Stutzerimonas frequens]MBK3912963.1 hypothetical protein [Stutzerimonas frequens]MBK3932215.1 hypothetical protein [Stutzerimonas frequens]